jgi:hypothetical protein
MFGQCEQTAEEWDELQDTDILGPIILTLITDKRSVMLWTCCLGEDPKGVSHTRDNEPSGSTNIFDLLSDFSFRQRSDLMS